MRPVFPARGVYNVVVSWASFRGDIVGGGGFFAVVGNDSGCVVVLFYGTQASAWMLAFPPC